MFRDWQRTQTQSSATDLTDPEAANGCPVLRDAGTIAERHTRAIEVLEPHTCVLSRARPGILCFSLDIRLTWMAGFQLTLYGRIWVTPKGTRPAGVGSTLDRPPIRRILERLRGLERSARPACFACGSVHGCPFHRGQIESGGVDSGRASCGDQLHASHAWLSRLPGLAAARCGAGDAKRRAARHRRHAATTRQGWASE